MNIIMCKGLFTSLDIFRYMYDDTILVVSKIENAALIKANEGCVPTILCVAVPLLSRGLY